MKSPLLVLGRICWNSVELLFGMYALLCTECGSPIWNLAGGKDRSAVRRDGHILTSAPGLVSRRAATPHAFLEAFGCWRCMNRFRYRRLSLQWPGKSSGGDAVP